MKREELMELHFITSIANLPTLLKYGIQSHHRAEVGRKKGLLQPVSVAMQEIQDIRANKSVPGQRLLHTYANLYFCARNPMLFKRKEQHLDICVLRVHTDVLDSAGAIITDRMQPPVLPVLRPRRRDWKWWIRTGFLQTTGGIQMIL